MAENQMLDLIQQYGSLSDARSKMPAVSLVMSNGATYGHEGRINAISGTIDESTGAVGFRAVFDNPAHLLRNGGNGTIGIPVSREDCIVIPQAATYEIQNKIFVYKVVDGKAQSAQIQVYKYNDGNNYIVESGLDVPNANTIIIERADRFGLAELYQLRGRVGRWKHQAYAYLLLPRSQLVSSDARKRLAAIRRCSNLGAGFQLALRDLEIRGSGNLLGAEQSGHLNTIGFDLYCQLLSREVASLRGETVEFLPDVDLAIDFVSFTPQAPPGRLPAAFPPEYIGGDRLRLDAYRKLGSLRSEAELQEFADELRDRYGKLPPPAENLLAVVRLRLLAARAGYENFSVVDGKVTLKNPGGTVYRLPSGKIPVIDTRDRPELRMVHLLQILRAIPPR